MSSLSRPVGIALILICILAFALVERDRQRRIARIQPPEEHQEIDEGREA